MNQTTTCPDSPDRALRNQTSVRNRGTKARSSHDLSGAISTALTLILALIIVGSTLNMSRLEIPTGARNIRGAHQAIPVTLVSRAKLDRLNRYDPRTTNRISDDLVDVSDRSSEESDDADNDNIIIPDKLKDNSLLAPTKPSKNDKTKRRLPAGRTIGRLILQVASIAIVLFCIGSVILYNNSESNDYAPSTPQLQLSNEQTSEQLRLLEIAEEVVLQCSEEMFDTSGMEACQILCHDRLCCFDEGDYSCEDDEDVNCPVYVGCGALLGFE